MTETTRRSVVLGAGGLGVTALLTACGGGEPATQGPAAESPAAKPSGSPAAEKGAALAKAADIPVGGGKVFKDEKIVVTQPKAGEFKAFASLCTHRGCDVDSVADGVIVCPCHGSKFAIADGSVTDGPAPRPLEKKTIKVEGGSILLG
ncbi:Rieske 2Fe-2S domain-containing protein [Streptosporangium saharense]|uniref:Rieske (2Fe-2S) protein n=1 Tax=Streptosporangium saharense TaxID=1706840 RepID=UPI003691148C